MVTTIESPCNEHEAMSGKGAAIDPELLKILVCPISRGPLVHNAEGRELISETAGLAYPIRNGIPVMLVDEARKL